MSEQPDIIFIVLDTQRADRLGCYGNGRSLTPNLDRFAQDGVLFEQAVSPAQWTIPSHASMFTGMYPTAHQVTEASHSLPENLPHLAELMRTAGYETIGFCNNPLVGVLNNGLKRGFDTFYNYGGAFPSLPQRSNKWPWPIDKVTEIYTQFLRRISYPIQNYFGQSDLAFRLSLNAWLTPLWSRFANFKGQNELSVKDVSYFLNKREAAKSKAKRPLFLFLNLMETHLPFWPPAEFIDQVAPYLRHDKEARRIMHQWNREAYRWAAPLKEPLSPLESRVLNDLYDAEVAYQDWYLGQLFETLAQRQNRDNTLTVLLADHGDGLGEHGYMGHAFVAYEELIHVPMMLQWPRRFTTPKRVTSPVSTRRVFHTMVDAIGKLPTHPTLDPVQIRNLNLANAVNGRESSRTVAYSEVYPPQTFIKAIESRDPELLEQFRCLSTRRAVVKAGPDGMHKLIHLDDQPDELFNLSADPLELENVKEKRPLLTDQLSTEMSRIVSNLETQQADLGKGQTVELDDQLIQRLRGLGYID